MSLYRCIVLFQSCISEAMVFVPDTLDGLHSLTAAFTNTSAGRTRLVQTPTFYTKQRKDFQAGKCSTQLTCSVLSNHRFPLFQRVPPPCSICAATRLWYISSDTRGIGASKQTVKMLFWMARTDSLFVLSREGEKHWNHTYKTILYPYSS